MMPVLSMMLVQSSPNFTEACVERSVRRWLLCRALSMMREWPLQMFKGNRNFSGELGVQLSRCEIRISAMGHP